jgi:DNA-binding response OmpR family regulator
MAKILLVEDDINLRDIYSARFTAEGYQVITASDGEEALATAVRERPDLIILDVMMPKISGFDVLDILRSTPETKQTKVIMMTALSQETDRKRGESLGANKYLIKSQVTLEDVVNTAKEMMESPSQPAPTATNQPTNPGPQSPTGGEPPASPPASPPATPPTQT